MLGGRGRRDPEFDNMSEFIASLRTNLTSIDRVALKLIGALNGRYFSLHASFITQPSESKIYVFLGVAV